MKDKSENISGSKSKALIAGAAIGLTSVIVLSEFFKAAIIIALTGKGISFEFNWFNFKAVYNGKLLQYDLAHLAIICSPFIANIFFIELTTLIMKSKIGMYRFLSLMVIQFFNITWLLFGYAYIVFAYVFKFDRESEWQKYLSIHADSNQQFVIIMFFAALILFTYFSYVFKRVKSSLTEKEQSGD